MRLTVELAAGRKSSLLLRNPVMLAAGTCGYGLEYARIAEIERLGAIVSKGTTLRPRRGNAQPRTREVAAGLLNAIGLQNPGIETVLRRYAPIWSTWQTPVIVNIAGETVEEFAELAQRLEGVPGVAGIEVNVSCPNVRAGGRVFGESPEAVAAVTAAVRQSTTLPVIVKLSPNTGDARPTALAAAEAGADAVSLINTLTGMDIDLEARRPLPAHGTGGLSGPAIRPLALRMVYEVACELRERQPGVAVIGIGGITSASDALAFIMAGAVAVQIGTANFVNPRTGVLVLEGIEAFMRAHGIENIAELVGAALP
ncbi:MAG: dihydroorotate dehydrogenase [Thermogemmatispora sp.]|uniref:dihydroorotate dehydrogenase n=1 Tax=Thermogemmatispora sp. TaxID=1968838 RepID=UPI0019D9F120|nr:dihydroorotate dehydrogenase [Thermogemmatispora sp.]MBE3567955.1 dihydroorotate dehydrogenase [Thermogemmatispora sp.]